MTPSVDYRGPSSGAPLVVFDKLAQQFFRVRFVFSQVF